MTKIGEALKPLQGEPKTIYQWYEQLPPEEQDALKEAVLSRELSMRSMFIALRGMDEPIPFCETTFKALCTHIRNAYE